MTRKYRPDDADSSKEDRWVAILSVLQECWDDVRDQDAQSPNAIAQMIEGKGIIVHRPFGRSGKKLGGGSSISFTLQALERRGWIHWASRPDGLSGVAYYITREGRDALKAAIEDGVKLSEQSVTTA